MSKQEQKPVKADWLASMIRNCLEQDEVLQAAGAVVVQMPGDLQAIVVFQPGGLDHLMIQVNSADVVIS